MYSVAFVRTVPCVIGISKIISATTADTKAPSNGDLSKGDALGSTHLADFGSIARHIFISFIDNAFLDGP